MHAMKSIVDCGRLPSPPNGNVATPSGTTVGNGAFYSCDEGLVLTGSTVRFCANNGLWTPDAPTCEGEDQSNKRFFNLRYCALKNFCKFCIANLDTIAS